MLHKASFSFLKDPVTPPHLQTTVYKTPNTNTFPIIFYTSVTCLDYFFFYLHLFVLFLQSILSNKASKHDYKRHCATIKQQCYSLPK